MPTRDPTHDDVRQLAPAARTVVERLFDSLADHAPATADDNVLVGLTLLRSSMDNGRAITKLLELDPVDFAGPAHALYRVQLEHYVRGAYFGDIATPEELKRFVKKNELPKRRDPVDGKKKNIYFRNWHREVHQHLGLKSADGLDAVVQNGWDRINGVVHGGAQILHAYTVDYPQIAFALEAKAQIWLLEAAITTVHHAAAFYLRIAQITRDASERLLDAALARKCDYDAGRIRLMTV